MIKEPRLWIRYILALLAGVTVSIVVLVVLSVISNQKLPRGPENPEILVGMDKARLAESIHLRQELGNQVWAGFGDADVPTALWNAKTIFLVLYPGTPLGWGVVPNDSFLGQPIFRKRNLNAENFTFKIGNVWVASIATKYETDRFIRETFRNVLPAYLKDIFPYRLLISNSEVQITAAVQEAFHAYQATAATSNFEDTLLAEHDHEHYWKSNAASQNKWIEEMEPLVKAVRSTSPSERKQLVREFLEIRDQRRHENQLDETQIAYERRLEWLNGVAKYVSLEIWRQASLSASYQPVSQLANDPAFKKYKTFQKTWQRELNQAKSKQSSINDTRFTYSGMLQAELLDRLSPGWQSLIFQPNVTLEGLLRIANEK